YIILTNQDLENWSNKSNIEVIPNALTFESSEVSSLKNKKIISLGRYNSEKGYDILIDIWKNVEKVNKEWVLEIYGDGELKEEYEYKIKKLKLKNIFLKTSVKNVKEKLLESSMYVMSSRREGLPMVLLEAMTCGLPLISFNCKSGPAELIQENVNGFLIPLFDIQKFSERILELIQNEDKRQEMGIQSKILSNNFKEDKIMNKWRDLFEKLEAKNTRN
ncbi:MAG: glycosyltransferase, partial [Cetobacterium sp.]